MPHDDFDAIEPIPWFAGGFPLRAKKSCGKAGPDMVPRWPANPLSLYMGCRLFRGSGPVAVRVRRMTLMPHWPGRWCGGALCRAFGSDCVRLAYAWWLWSQARARCLHDHTARVVMRIGAASDTDLNLPYREVANAALDLASKSARARSRIETHGPDADELSGLLAACASVAHEPDTARAALHSRCAQGCVAVHSGRCRRGA